MFKRTKLTSIVMSNRKYNFHFTTCVVMSVHIRLLRMKCWVVVEDCSYICATFVDRIAEYSDLSGLP